MPEIDWDELERLWDEQRNDSAFSRLGDTLVPGEGDNPTAFIIGEAPGAQETLRGRPFMGPSGNIQRQLMSFAGLHVRGPWFTNDEPQSNAWLTNVIKFRPPRNRKPYWAEILAARPYIMREWRVVGSPSLIIAVGGSALSAVLGRQTSILKLSGKLHVQPGTRTREDMYLWPMINPAFGLRQPAMQELIERDWERLAAWMRNENYP